MGFRRVSGSWSLNDVFPGPFCLDESPLTREIFPAFRVLLASPGTGYHRRPQTK